MASILDGPEITITSDGNVLTVPEGFARTDSQMRWLTQPIFSGAAEEPHITIDNWNRYVDYSSTIVYRSTKETIQDIIGTLYLKNPKVASFIYWNFSHTFERKVQRWGFIALVLGTRRRWRVL